MAVTYRRTPTGTPPPQDDVRLRRTCRGCGSVHELDFAGPDVVVVRTGERTCMKCAPPGATRRPGTGTSFIKAWWIVTDDGHPQWKILRNNGNGGVDYMPTSQPDIDPESGTEAVDTAAWREFARNLCDTDWKLLGQRWRTDHCATIDGLAEALDVMWSLIGPAGRIVIRLTGVPSTAVVMLTQTVTRSLTTAELLPIAALGRSLRALGTLACASTADIASCPSARRLFGAVPARPEPGVAGILDLKSTIAALTGAIGALPFGVDDDATPPPATPAVDQPSLPSNPLGKASGIVTRFGGGLPTGPAVFGTRR